MNYLMDVLKTGGKIILRKSSAQSYSQFGEDVVLASLFKNKKKGTYVDVGAFHPTQYSNTYLFYRSGWSGVAVDPNPRAEALFRIFRPRDRFYTTAVGEKEGESSYAMFADPAYNTLNQSRLRKLEESSSNAQRGKQLIAKKSVPVRSLKTIISEQGVDSIDLLSIDVEGYDLEVLKSHDWNIPPQVVVAEDHHFDIENPKRSDIYRFLMEKDYILFAVCGPSLLFKSQKAER